MLDREAIEGIKMRYPKGTQIKLHEMEGEEQMPFGLSGEVICVDDIGQVHVKWENGSTLALHPIKDKFEVLSAFEYEAERKEQKFIDKVNWLLKITDLEALHASCNSKDTSYAAVKLLELHLAFEAAYGKGYVDESYGMITVPGIVRGRNTGIHDIALMIIDLESSGEHWGTTFITKNGPLVQGRVSLTEDEKTYIAKNYIPYDYWYTPLIENDIHVSNEDMPESVAAIMKLVTESINQREVPVMEGPA